ncbi:MAG: hypothetical protein D6722_23880, partial [Bacteroidetes bacterium]
MCLFILSLPLLLAAAPPTVPASNLAFNLVDGDRFYTTWTAGNGGRRIVIARAGAPVSALPVDGADYNASTTLGGGDELAPGEFVVYDGTGSATWVYGLSPATTYHLAIFEYNGTGFSTEYLTASPAVGSQATLSYPSVQASNVQFSNVTGNSLRIDFSPGDGIGHIVLMKAGGPVDADPVDLTAYVGNDFFGNGSQIGTGNRVVYQGASTFVQVSNLAPNTTYHVAVYAYNGANGRIYLRPGATGSQLTATTPTQAASNLSFSGVDGNRLGVSCTAGNGARRIVVVREGAPVTALPVDGVDYQASPTLGSGDDLGGGAYVVYDGLGTATSVLDLLPGTTYHVAVFEYNGAGANTYYLTAGAPTGSQTTLSAPSVQASNLTFSNVTGNSLRLDFSPGNGSGRLVLMRAGGPVNANPQDLASYFFNDFFGNGSQIGSGNYVVYQGASTFVQVFNLNPATTYHVAVFEYNGSNGKVFLSPGATASQATAGAPTQPSTSLNITAIEGDRFTLSWTSGNGVRRIVLARAGSPVAVTPTDGVDYTASSTFGSGDVLAGGTYVVYDGSGTATGVFGLSPATTYHFAIFEYNGSGASTLYLSGSPLSGSASTISAPLVQASNLAFSNVTGNSMQIGFTPGNGTGTLLLMKAGAPVDADPVDNGNYVANSVFGNGSQLGTGNRVVYQGVGNSVTVTNLVPGQTYHLAAYAYNGFSGKVFLRPGAVAAQATGGAPTLPSSNPQFAQVDGDRFQVSWTAGNGARRLVVARAGAAVSSAPVNGQAYTASSTLGNGSALAPGEYVVYDGSATAFTLQGLSPETLYHLAIFEYNGSGATAQYQTATFLTASQSTLSPPAVQAANLLFSNVTGTTLQFSWTPGDGSGHVVVAKAGSPVDADPVDGQPYLFSQVFGAGSEIGNGNFVLYRGNLASVPVTSLTPNVTYHFAVYAQNGANFPLYRRPAATGSITTVATPTVPASNLAFSQVGYDRMQAQWTAGNGSRRLVLARQGAPVNAAPVDGTGYTAAAAFGAGDEIGTGNYVVYDGVGNSVALTGLAPGSTYHLAVFEYGGQGGTAAYLSPGTAGSQALAVAPLTGPVNLTFPLIDQSSFELGWTAGSGSGHLVVVTQGAPLSQLPQSGTAYTALPTWGSGSAIGNGYVVYSGSGGSTTVTGLTAGTVYRCYVFAYNGTAVSPALLTPGLDGETVTLGAPALAATNPQATNLLASSATLSWTSGGGQGRLVVLRLGSPVSASPADGVAYVANSFFGSGEALALGQHAVYASNGNSVSLTNLQPSTTYHFALYEYTGSGASLLYQSVPPLIGSFTTDAGSFPVEW